ncbi:MAG TPA: hydantoinase/oxoprolinase family protein, partial [Blastocatellia bacterium]|nr:hydantoinase/oxoprolinase family protein [Blastocatellia bacterium]
RGHDPRLFTMVSFGGAGGLHAVALAELLRIPQILIPAYPGAFSALGVLLADVIKEYSQTVRILLPASSEKSASASAERQLKVTFAKLERMALRDLRNEGFSKQQIELIHSLAVRYNGQSFDLEVPFRLQARNPLTDLIDKFHKLHQERYGHSDQSRTVEVVSVRLKGSGKTQKPHLAQAKLLTRKQPRAESSTTMRLTRKAQQVPVFKRENLLPGMVVTAPALIIEYGSTTLIPDGWRAKVDEWQNLIISRVR